MQTILNLYHKFVSPFTHLLGRSVFGPSFSCRFEPTCSQYAKEAINKYGLIIGLIMATKRLLRCHPASRSPHFDPVR